jgi:hypothetical protein
MTRIKKKPQKFGWKSLAEILRYGFFILYVIGLGGIIAGTRWISNLPEESDQKIEQQMQQRLLEKEKQHAEESLAAQQEAGTAANPETEIMASPHPAGVENAPA